MTDNKILQSILDTVNAIQKSIFGIRCDIKELDTKLSKRIDKIGLQIANLEDHVPTIEEFDNLEKRVIKLEKRSAVN